MGILASLVRVPIDYILEYGFEVPALGFTAVSSISMPSPPTGITYQRSGASSVAFTLGDDPIREYGKMKAGMLTLTGLSGTYRRSTYTKFGSIGGITNADGQTSVTNFERFLDDYHKIGIGEGTVGALARGFGVVPVLIFRAIKENINVYVEVAQFAQGKSIQGTRHFPSWRLDLRIWGQAGEGFKFKNIFSPVSDAFETAAAAVDRVSDSLATADNIVQNLRGDLESLRAPLRAVNNAADALNRVVQSSRTVLSFPRDLVADFTSAAIRAQEAWRVARESTGLLDPTQGGALGAEWERLKRQVGWSIEDSYSVSGVVAGLSYVRVGDIQQASARLEVADETWSTTLRPLRAPKRRVYDNVSTISTTLQAGQSLTDLALRYYKDPSRWIEIADYNGWLSAHVMGTGEAAQPGQAILIPGGNRASVETGVEGDLLKRDLRVDLANGDLVFDSVGQDLQQVNGIENIVQALSLRFLAVAGSSRPFPTYGMPPVIGSPNAESMKGLVGAHAREQALRDPRIQDVSAIQLLAEGSTISVELTIVPVGDDAPITLLAPLKTR